MRRKSWLLVIGAGASLGLWLTAAPASAALWEWTDGAGRTHKARSLDDIPAEFRSTAAAVEETKPPAAQPEAAAGPARNMSAPPSVDTDSSSASDGDSGDKDSDGHDKQWWQDRVKAARKQVMDDEKAVNDMRTKVGHDVYAGRLLTERKNLSAAEEKLDADRKVLSDDLPKQARAAHAPQWWLNVK